MQWKFVLIDIGFFSYKLFHGRMQLLTNEIILKDHVLMRNIGKTKIKHKIYKTTFHCSYLSNTVFTSNHVGHHTCLLNPLTEAHYEVEFLVQ